MGNWPRVHLIITAVVLLCAPLAFAQVPGAPPGSAPPGGALDQPAVPPPDAVPPAPDHDGRRASEPERRKDSAVEGGTGQAVPASPPITLPHLPPSNVPGGMR